jgi:hypothetical protein
MKDLKKKRKLRNVDKANSLESVRIGSYKSSCKNSPVHTGSPTPKYNKSPNNRLNNRTI